jgi:hypothetical protein
MKLILFLALFYSCTHHMDYSSEEYKVRSNENLDEIIKNQFPEQFTKDKEENENLKEMLKMYNTHLAHFPDVNEGDIIFLTRPTSPFIPSL